MATVETEYEWDEIKRLGNIAKHGLDFLDAPLMFERPYMLASAKTVEGELRHAATGLLGGFHVTVVFTRRPAIRIISFRRANSGEKRGYQALHGS